MKVDQHVPGRDRLPAASDVGSAIDAGRRWLGDRDIAEITQSAVSSLRAGLPDARSVRDALPDPASVRDQIAEILDSLPDADAVRTAIPEGWPGSRRSHRWPLVGAILVGATAIGVMLTLPSIRRRCSAWTAHRRADADRGPATGARNTEAEQITSDGLSGWATTHVEATPKPELPTARFNVLKPALESSDAIGGASNPPAEGPTGLDAVDRALDSEGTADAAG